MKRIVTVSIFLSLVLGCGSSGPPRGTLSGTVTYKSQPVNNCTLILYPASTDQSEVPHPCDSGGDLPHHQRAAGGITRSACGPFKGMPGGAPTAEGGSPEKAEERRAKLAAMQGGGGGAPTIPIPAKYEDKAQTDLKRTVHCG